MLDFALPFLIRELFHQFDAFQHSINRFRCKPLRFLARKASTAFNRCGGGVDTSIDKYSGPKIPLLAIAAIASRGMLSW